MASLLAWVLRAWLAGWLDGKLADWLGVCGGLCLQGLHWRLSNCVAGWLCGWVAHLLGGGVVRGPAVRGSVGRREACGWDSS